ncbi:MAG: phosphatase PAP2 family protein [Gemmatimonadaceae bacterium]
MNRQIALFVTLLAYGQSARAQDPRPLFTPADGLLAGGVVAATLLARSLDDRAADRLQDSSTQANAKLHALAMFVRTTAAPGALVIGVTMYGAGRLAGNDRMAQLGLHGTEALLVGELAGGVIKGVVGRQRPYVKPRDSKSYALFRGLKGDEFRSFPSGHSVAAFAAAAAVTSETAGWWPNSRWIIGPALFGGAALTGISRMYDNRHWATDVIVGAGIGTFAGLKVVRFNGSHSGNRLDRWLLAGSIIPNGDGSHAIRWSVMPVIAR